MFYYIKIRKKGALIWKALRKEGRILVFNKYEDAKKYADSLIDFVCDVVTMPNHPSHRRSPIYGKKYKKAGW